MPQTGPTLVESCYFECVDGKSNKFWEISVVGNALTTRWGRIGTKGQSKTKKLSSAEAAWAERNETIADKLAHGYKEIEAAPPAEATAADHRDATAMHDADQESDDEPDTSARSPELVQPDSSPTSAVPEEIEQLVWTFVREYRALPNGYSENGSPEVVPAGRAILNLGPADQVQIVKACYLLLCRPTYREIRQDVTSELRERLLKKQLPFSPIDVEVLAEVIANEATSVNVIDKPLLAAIEQWATKHPLTEKTCEHLRLARDVVDAGYIPNASERTITRIDVMVGDDKVRNPTKRKEIWSAAVIDDVEQLPTAQRTAWIKLLWHCAAATSGKPSTAWIDNARVLVAAVTPAELHKWASKWFPLVDKPWPEPRGLGHNAGDPLFIVEPNQDILRGLVWCCSLEPDEPMARIIGALGVSAYRKIRFIGARAIRVGNACVFALGVMANASAVAQLAMMKVKVKFGTAQRFIATELDKAAERLGVPRDELEEMSVPAFGLDDVGQRRESLGDFTAELQITASGDVELRWLQADGTPQKTVPAAVQKECAEEFKELKAAVKDIEKMLPIQRERIDSLFLQRRTWPLPAWRERYLDHPLIGTIARRVIWQFRNGEATMAGIFHDGDFVDVEDRAITKLADSTTVELWHPIGRSIQEIVAWRDWLERHQVQQPFKQAHREVYLLTDAEVQTEVYSNRFAAHILRQAQFRALASMRAWQTQLLGYWDGGDSKTARRHLPQWDLDAEFWLSGIPPEDTQGADPYASAGMPFISTDQVRFCHTNEPEPVPLAQIPPIVFSEIMRDVDLFVGVASIGNDPAWMDGGPDRPHNDYWTRYSFGDLSATARTRSEVLARLVPRLKIADRCSLADRFLVVRGDLRTYKIHLGSGNILMTPNDQYLCIVPKRKDDGATGIFLPFEGDRTLSIILSKAFLLADDTKIKDPTIMRQIKVP